MGAAGESTAAARLTVDTSVDTTAPESGASLQMQMGP